MKGQIIHVAGTPEYPPRDISNAVQELYNLIAQSFGSGFYSINELEPIAKLGELCGFERASDVRKYIDDEQHDREQIAFLNDLLPPDQASIFKAVNASSMAGLIWEAPVVHDHIYSSVGRCLWPFCTGRLEAIQNTDIISPNFGRITQ